MTENQGKPQALAEIQKILHISNEKRFKEGEMIFEEGQEDTNFYIIMMGNVEISKKTSEGKPKVIAHLEAGEFLGEGVLSGATVKPASAKAVTETSAMVFAVKDFEALVESDPKTAVDFLLSVLEAANGRLNKTNEKLLALFEISQLLHLYRDDLNQLATGLVNRLLAIIESKDGIIYLKNPFAETYRTVYTTSPDLSDQTFKGIDLSEPQKVTIGDSQFLVVKLKELGVLALRRDIDYAHYSVDQLKLLSLIADQAALTIEEANQRASDKARKVLERKHFEL